MSSIYNINKGINKSIEFKGLKSQYIWYLGGGMVGLLILYAILYFFGINTYINIIIILVCGGALTFEIYRLSNTYGEHGLMKKLARRKIPAIVRCRSRHLFKKLAGNK